MEDKYKWKKGELWDCLVRRFNAQLRIEKELTRGQT